MLWFWAVGFYVAFLPPHVLGLEAMTRRMQYYAVEGRQPWLIVAVAYKFWMSLLSDFVLLAGFYAAYAVLLRTTAGGPRPKRCL